MVVEREAKQGRLGQGRRRFQPNAGNLRIIRLLGHGGHGSALLSRSPGVRISARPPREDAASAQAGMSQQLEDAGRRQSG